MTCRGICEKYKAKKHRERGSWYEGGHKRCSVCNIYIVWGSHMCPCCHKILRLGTRIKQARPEKKRY